MAMNRLGNGLLVAKHPDALSVKETELSMLRRLGASEADMLVVQSNLANAYGESLDGSKMLCGCIETYTLHGWSFKANIIHEPLLQPTTTRHPFWIYGATQKPSRCCARRYPWRDAFSQMIMSSRSG